LLVESFVKNTPKLLDKDADYNNGPAEEEAEGKAR